MANLVVQTQIWWRCGKGDYPREQHLFKQNNGDIATMCEILSKFSVNVLEQGC